MSRQVVVERLFHVKEPASCGRLSCEPSFTPPRQLGNLPRHRPARRCCPAEAGRPLPVRSVPPELPACCLLLATC